MDHELEFELLETATSVPAQSPGSTGRLRVAERPEPFVRPTLILRASESTDPRNPLATEVVFIEASAAVGKSTMANYLSASRRAPLLNLAEVPVSTGSLLALVSGLPYPTDPVQAFHRGDLPLIIDALDEGRLLSGETGFEKFMETTGELLLQNRAVPDRPKVIMFGRRDSTELARIALEATGGPRSSWLEVGFFGRDAAWGMIRAYAEAKAAKDAAYHAHPGPVGQLNEAYFDAIEAALGLGAGALWTSERGRAFAGYAPVLAAIGSLLAGMDNFIEVTNTLRATGAREAWDVIEAVLQEILDRERRRLGELLRGQITVPVPPEAYDSEEQLKLLNQFVHGQPLVGSGRVALRGRDEATYNTMVGQRLPEHPFVKQQGFSNPVLASVVLAHGVFHDLLRSVDLRLVADASRQPFLYRSLRRHLKTAPLIDGAYLGFVLNSFWNDPINKAPEVVIRSSESAAANVALETTEDPEVAFEVTLPMTLYAQAKDCDVDVAGAVKLEGSTRQGGQPAFYIHGVTVIICEKLEVVANSVLLDGVVWLEAAEVVSPARLNLRLRDARVRVGWGGEFTRQFPWNRIPPTLRAPWETPAADPLKRLVDECSRRLASAAVLTLHPDFSIPDDPRMRWALRQFPEAFPRLIGLMVDCGLASSEPVPASGASKVRVHFNVTWDGLRDALENPTSAPQLQDFVTKARNVARA